VLVGDQRMGEKEEEAEGIRFPYLPWAATACGDGSTAAAEGGGAGYGRQAPALRQGRKVAVVVRCGGLGSGRPPFIGGGRRFGRGFFELGKLRGSTMAGRKISRR
jgi:hypothetical protein